MNYLDAMHSIDGVADAEAKLKEAMLRMHQDPCWRAVIMSCVACAMNDRGPVDPERADRDAHDIAIEAVTRALAMLIEGDSALKTLQAERDHYRDMAIHMAHLAPPPRFIRA